MCDVDFEDYLNRMNKYSGKDYTSNELRSFVVRYPCSVCGDLKTSIDQKRTCESEHARMNDFYWLNFQKKQIR
jgi:hypothetical protein